LPKALLDYGYAQGRSGYRWRKAPPILDKTAADQPRETG
jgi:hypothetical protein